MAVFFFGGGFVAFVFCFLFFVQFFFGCFCFFFSCVVCCVLDWDEPKGTVFCWGTALFCFVLFKVFAVFWG